MLLVSLRGEIFFSLTAPFDPCYFLADKQEEIEERQQVWLWD